MSPEHWLNVATHGLAPQAAARVRAEYLAYLEDAQAAGESVRDVLRVWGDPHVAHRDLRRAHLTTREARALPAGYAPTWPGLGRAVGEDAAVLAVLAFVVTRDVLDGKDSRFGLLLVGAGMATTVLRWLLLSRGTLRPGVRAALHWLLSPLSFGLLAVLGVWAWTVWHTGPERLTRDLGSLDAALLLFAGYGAYHVSRLFTALGAARKASPPA